MLSVFDLFRIGIGPSSSHTVGPMRAALHFVRSLEEDSVLQDVVTLEIDLFGSLGATGLGHGTDKAIVLGLEGECPEKIEPDDVDLTMARTRADKAIRLLGSHRIRFDQAVHTRFTPERSLPLHPNALRLTAMKDGAALRQSVYYSIGGGAVIDEDGKPVGSELEPTAPFPYPFRSAADLLAFCHDAEAPVSFIMERNEACFRPPAETRAGILKIWKAMQACVERGCRDDGLLPGGLRLRRRAPGLSKKLSEQPEEAPKDPLGAVDWVDLFAMAVGEENASGGRVVTAPTNGAAGVIPAVLHYYDRFCGGASEEVVARFFLTAGAVGVLYKENASISGAEVGCQGEIGSACSMAAGALAEILGGSPEQVENAAEIGMEHNLGLTCDPVRGLVQVPCIERNAMAAVAAINAAHMALRGDGRHVVSLDNVIKTMRETGEDMKTKYKETAGGGLAVNVTVC